MRILVTGAAGYIGAPTLHRLIAAGHTVRGLDSLRFGGAALLGAYPTGRFDFVRGDIRDSGALARALDGVDAVVHLAAIVGDPACAAEPELAREVNLDAAVALHEQAERAGVRRLVFASTCSVYGHCDQMADEDAPLRPLSLYAETKAEAEHRILAAGGAMKCAALRFATLYGLAPRMRFDLVANTFVRHALTRRRVSVHAPRAWRPLVHVADIAAAIAAVVDAPAERVAGQVFNVAAEADNYRLLQVAELAAEVCGPGVEVDVAPVPGDARDYRVTGDRLTAATGWRPSRTLRDGLGEIAEVLTAGVLGEEADRATA